MSDVYTTYNSVLVLFNMTKVKLGMVECHFSAKVGHRKQLFITLRAEESFRKALQGSFPLIFNSSFVF